jgi:hypothetical protein
VLDLRRFDNVYMKLSGLNHFATDALYLAPCRSPGASFGSLVRTT